MNLMIRSPDSERDKEGDLMKRLLVVIGLGFSLVSAIPASAAPNPNPNAPAHAGTACANVLSKNPNTEPGGHISDTGGEHFFAVGQALCGL